MPITIDNELRTMTVPEDLVLGVESDEGVNVIAFEMPRYYNNFDLSYFTIRINYENAAGTRDTSEAEYLDVLEDSIEFSWIVGRNAASVKGDVKFNVCLMLEDDYGTVVQEFNTTPSTGKVLEGLEVLEPVSEDFIYDFSVQLKNDIINHLDSQLFFDSDAGAYSRPELDIDDLVHTYIIRNYTDSGIAHIERCNAVSARQDDAMGVVTFKVGYQTISDGLIVATYSPTTGYLYLL